MVKYAYAERVVKKVRGLLKYDERVRQFIMNPPSISIGSDYTLESIVWNYYEYALIVTQKAVVYRGYNSESTILSYRGFDELLTYR